MKVLIVNADDFGASHGVNRGIIRAHREGILTSTSLMVRQAAVEEACALSRENPGLDVGLHVDLGEWTLRDGEWTSLYERVPLGNSDAVREEIRIQLELFRVLMGRDPTHLDSHQHVHMDEPVRSVTEHFATRLGVPLRRCRPDIRYCGDFYGQDSDGTHRPDLVTAGALVRILGELPDGVTELCCHPAASEDLLTMYSAERPCELEALCAAEVRAAVVRAGIVLSSFTEYRRGRNAKQPPLREHGVPVT